MVPAVSSYQFTTTDNDLPRTSSSLAGVPGHHSDRASTPLTFGGLDPRHESQPDGTVWPTNVVGLAHDETWPNFSLKTTRWSRYEAPTFHEVFLPVTEEDLSLDVNTLSFASNTSMSGEICALKVRGV